MTMPPALRKFALTAHVAASVGFFGAVAGFIALAVAGLTSPDAQMVRAAYLAMELTAWFVIVPLALASLLTGLVQALGTEWGLFRHWWVLLKFLISVFATTVLLIYMMYRQTLSDLAGAAAEVTLSDDLDMLRNPSPLVHASVALVLLLVATTLSVYKPQGMTPYGARKQGRASSARAPRWLQVSGIIALVLILLVLLIITGIGSGHGPGRHLGH